MSLLKYHLHLTPLKITLYFDILYFPYSIIIIIIYLLLLLFVCLPHHYNVSFLE